MLFGGTSNRDEKDSGLPESLIKALAKLGTDATDNKSNSLQSTILLGSLNSEMSKMVGFLSQQIEEKKEERSQTTELSKEIYSSVYRMEKFFSPMLEALNKIVTNTGLITTRGDVDKVQDPSKNPKTEENLIEKLLKIFPKKPDVQPQTLAKPAVPLWVLDLESFLGKKMDKVARSIGGLGGRLKDWILKGKEDKDEGGGILGTIAALLIGGGIIGLLVSFFAGGIMKAIGMFDQKFGTNLSEAVSNFIAPLKKFKGYLESAAKWAVVAGAFLKDLPFKIARGMMAVVKGIGTAAKGIVMAVPKIIKGVAIVIGKLKDAAAGVVAAGPKMLDAASKIVHSIKMGFKFGFGRVFGKLAGGMSGFFADLGKKGVSGVLNLAGKAAGGAGKGMFSLFKGALKGIFLKMPGIGTIISFGLAIKKFIDGDTRGGFLGLASALAGMIPIVGWAASLAIDMYDAKLTEEAGGDIAKKNEGFNWTTVFKDVKQAILRGILFLLPKTWGIRKKIADYFGIEDNSAEATPMPTETPEKPLELDKDKKDEKSLWNPKNWGSGDEEKKKEEAVKKEAEAKRNASRIQAAEEHKNSVDKMHEAQAARKLKREVSKQNSEETPASEKLIFLKPGEESAGLSPWAKKLGEDNKTSPVVSSTIKVPTNIQEVPQFGKQVAGKGADVLNKYIDESRKDKGSVGDSLGVVKDSFKQLTDNFMDRFEDFTERFSSKNSGGESSSSSGSSGGITIPSSRDDKLDKHRNAYSAFNVRGVQG